MVLLSIISVSDRKVYLHLSRYRKIRLRLKLFIKKRPLTKYIKFDATLTMTITHHIDYKLIKCNKIINRIVI